MICLAETLQLAKEYIRSGLESLRQAESIFLRDDDQKAEIRRWEGFAHRRLAQLSISELGLPTASG